MRYESEKESERDFGIQKNTPEHETREYQSESVMLTSTDNIFPLIFLSYIPIP